MNMTLSSQRMGGKPLLPLILSLSFPVMLSLLIQALYNVVDSIYIARFSEHGLAAFSLAFPIQTFLTAVASGIGVGANILIARALGRNDIKQVFSVAMHSLLMGIIGFVVFAAAALPLLRPYYSFFSQNETVCSMGQMYTGLIVMFSIGVFVENIASRCLQATGCAARPMLFQITGAVINIILDPILIFGFWGIPAMGVKGAAIATIAGQFVAAALAVGLLLRSNICCRTQCKFRVQYSILKNIWSTGLPTILGTALVSTYVCGLNAVLVQFSEEAVSALGIYYKLQTFLLMPTYGLNQGIIPILSYHFGAKQYRRMWHTLWVSLAISTATLALGTVVFWCFTNQLMQIYAASPSLCAVGIPALRMISIGFPLFGITILMPALLQATGRLKQTTAIAILREVVLLVPLAWLFSQMGLVYTWLTFPISELLAAVLTFYFIGKLWKDKLHD